MRIETSLRVVQHLIRAELKAQHPQLYRRVTLSDIAPDLELKDGPLAIDSLTLVGLAVATATLFNLYERGTEDTLLGKRTPTQWAQIVCNAAPSKLVFKTSGSSGEPKAIEHELSLLEDEADFWASVMSPEASRIVAICPAHHIYGFIWTELLSAAFLKLNGRSLEIVDIAIEDLSVSTFNSNDIIVTVPSVWDFIAKSRMSLPANLVGVSSTAPLSPETAQQLRANPSLDALFEIYGSSETSAVGFRVTGTHYQLLPSLLHSASDEAELVRADSEGQFKRIALQDQLQWKSDREFLPLKRKDDVVQVGGHNVSPQWVAQKITEALEVQDCAVRSFNHQGRAALKAFITLKVDTEDNRHQIIWDLRERLPAHAMPKSFAFGTSLPMTDTGKLADWPLPA